MPKTLEQLRIRLENGAIDLSLLAELEKEHADLIRRVNELEELLIMIVRTGWPWDGEGEPNAIYHTSRDGFVHAMSQASEILGLGGRSMLTRTEPRT